MLLPIVIALSPLLLILLVLLYFVIHGKVYYDYYVKYQNIPGNGFRPLIGDLFDIIRANKSDDPMSFSMKLVSIHGDVFISMFGPLHRLNIFNTELISEVLKTKSNHYQKPTSIKELLEPLIGTENLLAGDEPLHTQHRKMISPTFHFSNLKSMMSLMQQRTDQLIQDYNQRINNNDNKCIEINLHSEFALLALDIIAACAFGEALQNIPDAKQIINQTFVTMLQAQQYRLLRVIAFIPVLSKLPIMKRPLVDQGKKAIRQMVDQIITDRKKGISKSLCPGQDLLDMLINSRDENGNRFSSRHLREEACTFILAGHETSSNLLCWILFMLMIHQDVLAALVEEIDKVVGNTEQITLDQIHELKVVDAVIQETLRLYPPAVSITRQAIDTHVIGEKSGRPIKILKGTDILINTYVHHRNEKYFDNPLQFDYTRWLKKDGKALNPFAFIPFGAGPRNCIGLNFAQLEVKIILCRLFRSLTFTLVPGQKVIPSPGLTLYPKHGILANVAKRTV